MLLIKALAGLTKTPGKTMFILESFPLEMVTCMSVTVFQQQL